MAKNKFIMNPNTDYSIFSICLRNTNATTGSLPFVQTIRRQFILCQSIIAFRLVKIHRRRPVARELCQNRLQIRNLPNVFSGDILTKFTQIFFQKRENILFFLLPKHDSAQRLEMPQNCDKPASSTHFAIQLHIVFAARW